MDMGPSSPSSTSSSAMSSMSSMNGMTTGSCKVSMLWNWDTIDACFLAPSWHITSRGMFAGSCIGVVCLVVALEFLRRVQREYARWIERSSRLGAARVSFSASSDGGSDEKHGGAATARAVERSPSGSVRGRVDSTTLLKRHLVRSALHTMLFGVAYIVMLIAMSFNGYIIVCILLGAFVGSFVFGWDLVLDSSKGESSDGTGCCS